jgi:hypothetical protein
MHPEGCREHDFCSGRYSHIGDVAAVHVLVRPSYLQRYLNNPEQTLDRAQRVLRVGSRCYTVCAFTVQGKGREGKRAYMRTCGTTVSAR